MGEKCVGIIMLDQRFDSFKYNRKKKFKDIS